MSTPLLRRMAVLLAILCERWEDGPCCDPVLNGESQVSRRRRMEDSVVLLECLLRSEVARNCRVSAQRHHDGGRG